MTRGQRHTAARGAVAGLLSAGLLLAVSSTAPIFSGTGSDPFVAVGDVVVRLSPPAATAFAIETFGTYDKAVLFAGIGVVIALLAAASGAVATHRLGLGLVAPIALALAALAAVGLRPGNDIVKILPTVLGIAVAAPVFVLLVRKARHGGRADATAHVQGGLEQAEAGSSAAVEPESSGTRSRRGFLVAAGAVAAVAAAVATAGRLVGTTLRDAVASRDNLVLPEPLSALGPEPTGAQVSPVTPFRTPNADFYRIDTALSVPQVPAEEWRIRVHGLVDRPLDLDWAALTRYEVVEREVTLVCVSNEVGGRLAGNAVWRGVRLADVLADAGIRSDADMLLSTSVDSWTASTPLDVLDASDDALLAFGMNGDPLPFEHGFPVRMVVPGLYGYVSATKWVTDLKVTTFAADTAFWTPRGYAERAPVKVASRIDVPGSFEQLPAGANVVAGVAWAPGIGIDLVEVSVDESEWTPAELAPVPATTTWQQWRWEWDAVPGQHRLQVRATTSEGELQEEERAPIKPDGTTGWHSVVVTVT